MYKQHGGMCVSSFPAAPSQSGEPWADYLGKRWLPGKVQFDGERNECLAGIVQRQGGCTLAIIQGRSGYKITHAPQCPRDSSGQELVLYAVTAGGGEIREAHNRMRFSAGDILLRDRRLPSVIFTDPGFGCVAIRIPLEKLELGFRRSPCTHAVALPSHVSGIASLNTLLREQKAFELAMIADNFDRIERAVIALFNLVSQRNLETAPLDKSEERMVDIFSLIDANISNPDFRLKDVARSLNISERWIRKLFADRGLAFKSYLIERRLARAQEMLADPGQVDEKIALVAFECGFSDQAHLTRHFTKYFGQSPGRFRIRASAAYG